MKVKQPKPPKAPKVVMRVKEVAERLDVSIPHVIDLIDGGLLGAINVGGNRYRHFRIPVEEFERFLRDRNAKLNPQ